MEQVILAFQQTIELWVFLAILALALVFEPMFKKGH